MASGELSGKVAIITGASSGFGQATAILFAKKGASVVLCGRDEDRLNASIAQCVQASGGHADRFISVTGDLTESAVRKSILDKTVEVFKRVDILVANAGVLLPQDGILTATEESFDVMFNVNVKAVFFLIQTAVPHLEKSGGNVVCVSSVLSTFVSKGRAIYAMTKASVDHMTSCLALDLGPKGIRVNAVNPSYAVTRMRRSYGDNYEDVANKAKEMEDKNHPLRGQCIEPEDIANTIAFLASDAAKSTTGQCHVVDAGRHFVGAQ